MAGTEPEPVVDRATVDDHASLHRETYGTGPAVLIAINGGPGYGCHYMRPLAELAGDRRRVVLYDQLGTGRSDTATTPAQWSMVEYARHVDLVRQACGVDRVDIVGHSFGGMLALEYAVRYPAGVRRLVVANSTASVPRFVRSQRDQLRSLFGARLLDVVVRAEREGRYDDPDYELAMARFYAWADGKPYGADTVDLPAYRRQMDDAGPALCAMWGPGMFTASAAMRDWDVEAQLPNLRVPTLIISSELDHCPVEVTAPMADAIPSARWVLFQRTSHGVIGPDAPVHELFVGMLRGFLDTDLDGSPGTAPDTAEQPAPDIDTAEE